MFRHTIVARSFAPLRVACLVAFLIPSSGAFSQASPAIPDTPAGVTLKAFLHAFNSADLTQLQAYVKTYDPESSAENLLSFSHQTGGFTILSIEQSNADLITFRVQGRSDGREAFGSLRLATVDPPRVKALGVRALPPGAVVDNVPLDTTSRQRTIDAVIARLDEFYVYPDVAKKMGDSIRDHARKGDYNALTDGNAFAEALTKDLRAVSNDRHLNVAYNPFKQPAAPDGPGRPRPEDTAGFRKELERSNCSFRKVEILPGNIGYLRFDEFDDPDLCGATVVAAMNFLAHVDSIIFDLRENHGGQPHMVQLILSYLFDQPTHLNDLYERRTDQTTQFWTLPYTPGPSLASVPAFVLTSKQTFSGGEEFTYDLQQLKRATIVGEATGGGAHPMRGMAAGDHFSIGVPLARPINPVSKTDWEGKGVQPDVKVPASEALETAQKLAAKKTAP